MIQACNTATLATFSLSDVTLTYKESHVVTIAIPTDDVGDTYAPQTDICGPRLYRASEGGTNYVDPVYTGWSTPNAGSVDLTLNLNGNLQLINSYTLTIEFSLEKVPSVVQSASFTVTFTCDASETHGLTIVNAAPVLAFSHTQ